MQADIQVSSDVPVRRHKRNWKKIVMLGVLGIIAIPLLGCAWLIIGIYFGGIQGIIRELRPALDPKSSEVTSRRNAAKHDMEVALNELEGVTNFTYSASSVYDRCYKGRYGLGMKDPYLYRCDFRLTRYYGFNGDFRKEILDLDQKLAGQKWQASYANGALTSIIKEYYDQYYGDKDPAVSQNLGGTYLVSNVPGASYRRNNTTLDIVYAEKASKDIMWLKFAQTGLEARTTRNVTSYEDGKLLNVDSLFAQMIASNQFVLVITLEKNYFEN